MHRRPLGLCLDVLKPESRRAPNRAATCGLQSTVRATSSHPVRADRGAASHCSGSTRATSPDWCSWLQHTWPHDLLHQCHSLWGAVATCRQRSPPAGAPDSWPRAMPQTGKPRPGRRSGRRRGVRQRADTLLVVESPDIDHPTAAQLRPGRHRRRMSCGRSRCIEAAVGGTPTAGQVLPMIAAPRFVTSAGDPKLEALE